MLDTRAMTSQTEILLMQDDSTSSFDVLVDGTTLSTLLSFNDTGHNNSLSDYNYTMMTDGYGGNFSNLTNETDCYENIEHYSTTSIIIVGFITPFIIVFGLVANCLNFRIFTHRFMRVSLLNWYLAVLSVSDIIILLTAFFFLSLPRIGEYFQNWDAQNFSMRIVPLNYPLAMVAQTTSVWLTVLMSTHRFIGVCLPFKTARICTKTNCRIALICVVVFAIFFNITRFFEITVQSCYSNIINYTLIEPDVTEMRRSDTYQTVYYVWCYFIFMFLLPFLLLICLNTAVIMAIRNTSKLHLSVASGSEQMMTSKKKEMAKEVSTSIMLVGVVVVFLLCNTMAFVVNLLELIDQYNDDHKNSIKAKDSFHVAVDLSNVLVMLNSSINIFIYCSFSEKYRLLLKHYLTCSCYNNSEPLIDTTMTTHA